MFLKDLFDYFSVDGRFRQFKETPQFKKFRLRSLMKLRGFKQRQIYKIYKYTICCVLLYPSHLVDLLIVYISFQQMQKISYMI